MYPARPSQSISTTITICPFRIEITSFLFKMNQWNLGRHGRIATFITPPNR